MLIRALILTALLGLGAASTASAATLNVEPSITGAGSIAVDGRVSSAIPTCTQDPPATAAQRLLCVGFSISPSAGPVALIAVPATGWTFDGWNNCDNVRGNVC